VTLESYRQRMPEQAKAERAFVARYPDAAAYFHDKFTDATQQPPANPLSPLLANVIPREMGAIGERIWTSTDLYFRQQLAKPFLEAWEKAGEDQEAEADAER
jgi:hypothetical protein